MVTVALNRLIILLAMLCCVFLSSNTVIAQASDSIITQLSHASGFFDTPFSLTIEYTNADRVYYTVDGSVPQRNSKRFSRPIAIDSTMVVRLMVIDKLTKKRSYLTNTYFVGVETKFPVVSLALKPTDLWDSLRGIYTLGVNATWNDSIGLWENANYARKWERVANLEFFESDKNRPVNQAVGVRIFGGMTRKYTEKSLLVVARKKYGNNKIEHPIFLDKPIEDSKSFVLRTSGNDYRKSRFRDILTTQLVKNMEVDYQAYRPCLLFLNGEYWGVYNIREKINEHYLERNHDIEKDSVNLLQGRSNVDHGSRQNYKQMLKLFKVTDLNNATGYRLIDSLIDIPNFVNYFATQLFINNVDARGNIRYWQTEELDNKFRWILYDTDLGFGNSVPASHDFLGDLLSDEETEWYNPTWSTFLFREMMSNLEVRTYFIQQLSYLMNENLHTDTIVSKVDFFTKLYGAEMPQHYRLSHTKGSMYSWKKSTTALKSFAKQRPSYLRRHLVKHFKLESFVSISLFTNSPFGKLTVNENVVMLDKHQGKYSEGTRLKFHGVAQDFYRYVGYRVGKDTFGVAESYFVRGGDRVELLFEEKEKSPYSGKLFINELSFKSKNALQPGDWVELVNTSNQTISLKGWVLKDNSASYPLGGAIAPNKYEIIAQDSVDMLLKYDVEAMLSIDLGLSKQQDQIVLLDEEGRLVDSIVYRITDEDLLQQGIDGRQDFTYGRNNVFDVNDDDWLLEKGIGTPGAHNTQYYTKQYQYLTYYVLLGILLLLFGVIIYTVFFNRSPKNVLK